MVRLDVYEVAGDSPPDDGTDPLIESGASSYRPTIEHRERRYKVLFELASNVVSTSRPNTGASTRPAADAAWSPHRCVMVWTHTPIDATAPFQYVLG